MYSVPRTIAGRLASLKPTTLRRRVTLAISLALALTGLLVAPAMPAAAAEAAFGCTYSDHTTMDATTTDPGGTFTLLGQEFAGHYSGITVQPSSTGVTAAGIEAQCLLAKSGFSPGTIDGIFGPNSQAAAKKLQALVNQARPDPRIGVDGSVGPQTWPWLRCVAQNPTRCLFRQP